MHATFSESFPGRGPAARFDLTRVMMEEERAQAENQDEAEADAGGVAPWQPDEEAASEGSFEQQQQVRLRFLGPLCSAAQPAPQ